MTKSSPAARPLGPRFHPVQGQERPCRVRRLRDRGQATALGCRRVEYQEDTLRRPDGCLRHRVPVVQGPRTDRHQVRFRQEAQERELSTRASEALAAELKSRQDFPLSPSPWAPLFILGPLLLLLRRPFIKRLPRVHRRDPLPAPSAELE